MIGKIHNESCIATMKKMISEGIQVQATITSPPYDNLRTYKDDVDKSWGEHVWKPIIQNLYDVTADGGVVVWVVGDAVIKGSETGSSFRQALYAMECGFRLHDTMLYEKNSSAFPARRDGNRYTQIFEYMFIWSKGAPKANLICDKKNKWAGHTSWGERSYYNKEGDKVKSNIKPIPEFSPRNNSWKYNTGKGFSSKEKLNHPAIFPEKLAEDHILTWSDEGDVIYDPFMGSGTTAKMSILNNRKWIGSEISSEFKDEADSRLKNIIKID